MTKTAIIIGAGPAGLTAAYELLKQNTGIKPIVLEATDRIGGISCTINHNGNRIDIGGHRFFSKSDIVMNWWMERMPVQGAPAYDDKRLNSNKSWERDGPDPENDDRVMLIRKRISRIFYLRKFFDYPLSLKLETILNLGIIKTIWIGGGYLKAKVFKSPNEDSLETFLINRFGSPLYRMFFENYTEKVWGAHPRQILAEWGAQRIKGLSLSKALLDGVRRMVRRKTDQDIRQKNTDTSLIERFFYPKLGPGQMWEYVAKDVQNMGGDVLLEHSVVGIKVEKNQVVSVTIKHNDQLLEIACDECFSSMPIKDFVLSATEGTFDHDIRRIARHLPYRDFMMVGLLVDKLNVRNRTKIKTLNNLIPDTWIYIQEPDVRLCRLQIFNNWSPYMVSDPNKVWIGLEYMCSEDDDIWDMSDDDFIKFATDELTKIGIIKESSIHDACRIHIEKAYPAYFGSYSEFGKVRERLDKIKNLYCIGRNGQHHYNNQDHSMLTAMEAVKFVVNGHKNKNDIWNVNTEKEYHEEK